jgi:hypothetical protein
MFAGWTVAERLYTEARMLPVNYLPAPQGRRLLLCGFCTVIPATEYSISRANQTVILKEINFSNYTKLNYNLLLVLYGYEAVSGAWRENHRLRVLLDIPGSKR